MKAAELFALPALEGLDKAFFDPEAVAWQWIKQIALALEVFERLPRWLRKDLPAGLTVGSCVYIHPTVSLPPYGVIQGPCYIGAGTEIRPGAFIRANVIIGEQCVIGNACELKNSLLLNGVKLPHFNYIGDSVIGAGVHFGAGAIASNFRLDQQAIEVTTPLGKLPTSLRKLGALVGDRATIGCNAVLQPGTIIGRGATVHPLVSARGWVPAGAVLKAK